MKKVKSILTKIRLFLGMGLGFVQDHGLVAVTIAENLKKIVEGKLDNKIASLFPGTWAPELVAHLERIVPQIAYNLGKTFHIINMEWQGMSAEQIFQELVKHIQSEQKAGFFNKARRGKFLLNLAGHISYRLADKKYSMDEIWDDAQKVYDKFFKGK